MRAMVTSPAQPPTGGSGPGQHAHEGVAACRPGLPPPPEAGLLAALAGPARAAAAGWLVGYPAATRAAYARDLHRFAGWCADRDLGLLEVHRAHVDLYARHLDQHRGLAATTVARALSAIGSYYRWATDEQLVDRNPAARARRPRISREPSTKGLTVDEAAGLLATADSLDEHRARDATLVGLLLLEGLRVSEACAIRFADLGEALGYTTVTVTRKGGVRVEIPLHPWILGHLDELHLLAGELRWDYPPDYDDPPELNDLPLLYPTSPDPYADGWWHFGGEDVVWRSAPDSFTRYAAYRVVRRVAKRAGITRTVTPHTLRHTFVQLSLDAGAELRDVQEAAGHADPRTTTLYDRLRGQFDRHPMHQLGTHLGL